MSLINQAVSAREVLGEDFFGGWDESDVELFRSFATHSEPKPDKITDFMGVRTSASFHPWALQYGNSVLAELPIPDDGLRAEAIEYHALFDAINRSGDGFAMAEIGSSYAPWTCAAAVCTRRLGKSRVQLTAVEASSFLFGLIEQHLAENDVDRDLVHAVHGAAASRRTTLFFPKILSPADNGSQTADANLTVDYRGLEVETEQVQAYPLYDLLPDGMVDLIHIDVQGHEVGVLSAAAETLQQRVRAVFVGTHSREIEGELLKFFQHLGWTLHRERPTRFAFTTDKKDPVAWTTRDGGQYWRNPRL